MWLYALQHKSIGNGITALTKGVGKYFMLDILVRQPQVLLPTSLGISALI